MIPPNNNAEAANTCAPRDTLVKKKETLGRPPPPGWVVEVVDGVRAGIQHGGGECGHTGHRHVCPVGSPKKSRMLNKIGVLDPGTFAHQFLPPPLPPPPGVRGAEPWAAPLMMAAKASSAERGSPLYMPPGNRRKCRTWGMGGVRPAGAVGGKTVNFSRARQAGTMRSEQSTQSLGCGC